MRTFNTEEISSLNFNESSILSIKWINENGIDLEMDIDWCGQENLADEIDFNNVKTKLVFRFVSNLDVRFQHNEVWTIGPMEITEFKFQKTNIGQYQIEINMDFQPVGFIKFHCSNFNFVVLEKQLT